MCSLYCTFFTNPHKAFQTDVFIQANGLYNAFQKMSLLYLIKRAHLIPVI